MTTIRIWDLPLRLFHWLLVLLVVSAGLTGEFSAALGPWAARWHLLSGYGVLSLLIFRLLWGFAGSTYARFASFVRGPRVVLAYCGEVLGRRPARLHLGHNPLGGWSVLTMLGCLAVLVGSGLFISDEDLGLEGPLARLVATRTADWLASLHEISFTVLLVLVGTHLGAIAFYQLVKGDNLVKPMLTGVREVPPGEEGAAARGGHWLAGLLVLACAVGVVWLIDTRF